MSNSSAGVRRPIKTQSRFRFYPVVTVIITFGLISLLGDAVCETVRSANGQYLSLLGISAAQVGLIFGIGEFIGHSLWLITGLVSGRGGKHWTFMFVGYGMLAVVPLSGLTQDWNILVALILMGRIGKALRKPAKDAMCPVWPNTAWALALPSACRKHPTDWRHHAFTLAAEALAVVMCFKWPT